MKYNQEEKEIIQQVKEYLKAIRTLKREKFHLLEEYNELPSVSSPQFEETRGTSISQINRMNNYTERRELLLKKIKLFNHYIDQFMLFTFLLSSRQRKIIQVYLEAMSYTEMVEILENQCFISVSTYKRELPEICLKLASIIPYNDVPTLEKMNQLFYEKYISVKK